MTFAVGDKCIKVKVSEDPQDTPAGGPYTVVEVDIWEPGDDPEHELKSGCHAMRVAEAEYKASLEILDDLSTDIFHYWDCSCEFRHLPPSEQTNQSKNAKRPVTV